MPQIFLLSKQNIEFRQEFYSSKEYNNSQEQMHLKNLNKSQIFQLNAQMSNIVAGGLSLIPQFTAKIPAPKLLVATNEPAVAPTAVGTPTAPATPTPGNTAAAAGGSHSKMGNGAGGVGGRLQIPHFRTTRRLFWDHAA